MAWEWGRLIGRLPPTADAAGCWRQWPAAVLVLAASYRRRLGRPAGLSSGIVLQRHLAGRNAATALDHGRACLDRRGIDRVRLAARPDPVGGLATSLWLLAVVWAVDTAAYFAGRSMGGPKLAPRDQPEQNLVRPRRRRSLGGAGRAWSPLIAGLRHWWPLGLISGGLAIVAQIGDIAESYAKRRFGVKDTGQLIPGHGGLLDRLDGMLAAVAGRRHWP